MPAMDSRDVSLDSTSYSVAAAGFDLRRLLEDARSKLIQTGTRNRLVHCARNSSRGKFVDIVDEKSSEIFRILVREGRRMRFLHNERAEGDADAESDGLEFLAGEDGGDGRYTDLYLQTQLSEDKLQKRLLGMAREAKTLEEEQGVNALYLAIGFLRWYEDEKSQVPRQAPLILVPVDLKRNDLTSLYELVARPEDIVTNEPLKHRLHDDFGIRLPAIPEDEEWSPASCFEAVEQAIGGQSRWSIDIDGMQLGFFSFAKLLMVKDLEPESWPENGILDHPLLRGLLAEGFAGEPNDFPPGEKLDALFAPADLIQVVDADSSQTLVIEAVRKGRNLVVQGPPGTGKSQTITNIIAAAAHDGKTVLFMAEKMAALNVVHDRLKKAGLAALCLELHSRQANKKQVLEELSRTLGAPGAQALDADDSEKLRELRDRLNSIASVMHMPMGETGTTPFRVLSTLINLQEQGFVAPDLALPQSAGWSIQAREAVAAAVLSLARISEKTGPRLRHPLLGIGNTQVLPMDHPRLAQALDFCLGKFVHLEQLAAPLAADLKDERQADAASLREMANVALHAARLSASAQANAAAVAHTGNIAAAIRLAGVGQDHAARRRSLAGNFADAALVVPVAHLRAPLAAGFSFFGRWSGRYRSAANELRGLLTGEMPKKAAERIALVDQLIGYQQSAQALVDEEAAGAALLGPLWQRDRTDFDALAEAAAWLEQLAQISSRIDPVAAVALARIGPEELKRRGVDLLLAIEEAMTEAQKLASWLQVDLAAAAGRADADAIPLHKWRACLTRWRDNLDRLDEWSRLAEADAALRAQGCEVLAEALARGSITPDAAQDTLRFLCCDALYREFAAAQPWLMRLTFEEKAELVAAFAERDRKRFKDTARLIRGEHLGRLPRGGMGAMGIVRAEIGKRRAHKPIRRLVAEAGAVIQQLKPVMLMSPISVAQYLKPGIVEFDLLVIDEASQIRPEDALGAVARARQIVVVGDTKQLPPTSFFDRMVSDVTEEEDEDDVEQAELRPTAATELESVLTLCEARGLGSRMLQWHYRSRHPSLIEVSNDAFYNGDLILFPSPAADRNADGLMIRRVEGAYDRGGKRNNRIEAQAVVQAVARHAAHSPERSLGVVTFSTAQRDLITELLELARRDDDELDLFLREGRHEDVFVKNLENVQGDERDVILISVGYGPRIAGQRLDSMAFGPVSSEGGERRLNVLFTRARYRTQVFASFDSADIDLNRSKSVGARILKRFLSFAETGISDQPQPLGRDADSDFEVAVASAIKSLGYTVDHQVGSGGYRLDLAVRHPQDTGRYMLAIECDGATYHSSLWARERDRLRQEVLEGLGWQFHRIWSTDWFHRRKDEIRRLEEALVQASARQLHAGNSGSRVEEPPEDEEVLSPALGQCAVSPPDTQYPAYVVADFPVSVSGEPHELSAAQLSGIVSQIIDIEGPIHQDEIGRRVAALFGKQRAGARMNRAVNTALRHLWTRTDAYRNSGNFWMTGAQQQDPPIRDRSAAPLSIRRADMIPPLEIEAAALEVLRQNGAVARLELPRALALVLGFQRTGPEFSLTVLPVIDGMTDGGLLLEDASGMIVAFNKERQAK
jgi:very-short-patch-repair endonuclease